MLSSFLGGSKLGGARCALPCAPGGTPLQLSAAEPSPSHPPPRKLGSSGPHKPPAQPGRGGGGVRGRAGAAPVRAFARGLAGENPLSCTNERVIRYPDGQTRRLRYPVPSDGCLEDWAEGWETRNAFKRATATRGLPQSQQQQQPAQGRSGRAGGSGSSSRGQQQLPNAAAGAAAPAEAPPARQPQLPTERRGRAPSSPLELLRLLTSPEHQRSQQELWAKIRGSYEILEGCPWVAPKPLYVLSQQQQQQQQQTQRQQQHGGGSSDGEAGRTYTLRTRIAQADTEDELSRVLGRRQADGSPLLRCSALRDGVVAFEDDADAERYGQLLEADGGAEVTVARCDSHALFRSVGDVRGVVVLLRRGCHLPHPHQLATSLKGKDAFEE